MSSMSLPAEAFAHFASSLQTVRLSPPSFPISSLPSVPFLPFFFHSTTPVSTQADSLPPHLQLLSVPALRRVLCVRCLAPAAGREEAGPGQCGIVLCRSAPHRNEDSRGKRRRGRHLRRGSQRGNGLRDVQEYRRTLPLQDAR